MEKKKSNFYLNLTALFAVGILLLGTTITKAQTTISVDANYTPCNTIGIFHHSKAVEANSFQIVPNPNNGIFSLQFLSNSISNTGLYSLEIVDLLGREVFKQQIFVNEKTQAGISIELKKLPMGVYILKLSLPSGAVQCQKLVIE